MRSGINHDDALPEYRRATGLYPLKPDAQPTDLHTYIPTIQSSLSAAIDRLEGPPFEYISANADLMGWAIERASGKKFAEVLTESIWQPMGAESDAYVTVDRSGNARTAAGICATVCDIARLGQVILQGGQGIVHESWIKDILNNGSQAAFAAGSEKSEYEPIFDTIAYRSYWIADRSSQVLMASGTNGQLLVVDCKNGVVMAKTSSQPKRTDWGKIRFTMQAFKEFTRMIKGEDQ
jgi:CubicO group peptidase (beta-lactamase class C family)